MIAVCSPACSTAIPQPLPPVIAPDPTSGGGTQSNPQKTGGINFTFSTGITEPPTDKHVRTDNANQTLATKLWFDKTSSTGIDISNEQAYLVSGSVVYMQDKDNSALWVSYNVTGPPIDKGDYFEVPVTYRSGPGGIANNQAIVAEFIR